MKLFQDKVVLITGGSSGIGRATAVAFAREGAKVVVTSRRVKEGEETIQLVKETGSDGLFIKTDVSNELDVKVMVEETVKAYGRLDYAFNNAGIEGSVALLVEQTMDNYESVLGINVRGVFLSMKYEIPEMLKTGGGAIVNMSSVAGLIGFPGLALYVASKHAVLGLTKSAALEYAKSGIRINAVSPAVIETDMVDRVFGKKGEMRQQLAAMHPIGRTGKSEEIASAVLYLCSDGASFVTGNHLRWTADLQRSDRGNPFE
jgi:NAD(P)-dependent dehydrogenase (short-subunit alcohol dehydrogenase family)